MTDLNSEKDDKDELVLWQARLTIAPTN